MKDKHHKQSLKHLNRKQLRKLVICLTAKLLESNQREHQ